MKNETYQGENTCAYCGAFIEPQGSEERPPEVDDDRAWEEEAKRHLAGCEWVETRAHRITRIQDRATAHTSTMHNLTGLGKTIGGRLFKPDASKPKAGAECGVCGATDGVAWISGAGEHLCYKHQDDY